MRDIQLVVRVDRQSPDEDRQSSGEEREAARELVDWLRAELHVAPRISVERAPGTAPPTVVTRGPSVLEVIVAIPSMVLIAEKLADLTQAKDRLRRLSAWLRARRRRVTLRTELLEIELPGDDEQLDAAIDRLARRDDP